MFQINPGQEEWNGDLWVFLGKLENGVFQAQAIVGILAHAVQMLLFIRIKGEGQLEVLASTVFVLPCVTGNIMKIRFFEQHFIVIVQVGDRAVPFPDLGPNPTVSEYGLARKISPSFSHSSWSSMILNLLSSAPREW